MPFVNRCGSQNINLQSKTAYPSSSVQTITPDDGYDGLGQVVMNPRVIAAVAECVVPIPNADQTENPAYNATFAISGQLNVTETDAPRAIYIGINGEPQVYYNTTGRIACMYLSRTSLNPLAYDATVTILGRDNTSRILRKGVFSTFTVTYSQANKTLKVSIPSDTNLSDPSDDVIFATSYELSNGSIDPSKYWAILLW